MKKRKTKTIYLDNPKTPKVTRNISPRQPTEEEEQAIEWLQSANSTKDYQEIVAKIKQTFEYRYTLLDKFKAFPIILSTPGLIHVDFTVMFPDADHLHWTSDLKQTIVENTKSMKKFANISSLEESKCRVLD
jgi:hypothetical protein